MNFVKFFSCARAFSTHELLLPHSSRPLPWRAHSISLFLCLSIGRYRSQSLRWRLLRWEGWAYKTKQRAFHVFPTVGHKLRVSTERRSRCALGAALCTELLSGALKLVHCRAHLGLRWIALGIGRRAPSNEFLFPQQLSISWVAK